MSRTITVDAIPGIPEVVPGDDLSLALIDALDCAGIALASRDIVVVAQKIVSKAEGRYAYLRDQKPSAVAHSLGAETDKDPRIVELILSESRAVLRRRPGLIVVETHHGFVMANAGIDQSNIRPPSAPDEDDNEAVLLLPIDSDASAAQLRADFEARFESPIGVIISDSIGRAWRNGHHRPSPRLIRANPLG